MTIKKILLSSAFACLGTTAISTTASAQTPFLGEIHAFGYTFCPRGWTDANGQLLPIASYSALFSLYGTTYGGDGRTTFGLPDLRGRTPIHTGQGPGLTNRVLGSSGGTEMETLNVTQMPSHTHRAGIQTSREDANATSPRQNSFSDTADNSYYTGGDPSGRFMNPNTVTVDPAGSGLPHNNMMPFQTVRYCVALQGVFPSRN